MTRRGGVLRAQARRTAVSIVAVALGACARPSSPVPDALLLTIDTLRGDHWGCLGEPTARTPHLDRLARGGTLAFEGRSPVPITLPSHVSMMTGLPPAVHGVRDNATFRLPPDAGRTLAEALRSEGYATAAFASAFPLYPRFGLERGFDHYDCHLGSTDGSADEMRQRTAVETVHRVSRWLSDGNPRSSDPLFLWVHFFDPHADYNPPEPWRSLFPEDPYAGEVATADDQAGRLLAELAERRPGREQRIVVASDHGEGLYEHGESSHGTLLHTSTLRVPIVTRVTGYEPRLLPEPRSLERVPATVLSMLGFDPALNDGSAPPLTDPPTPVHGESLFAFFNFGWGGLRCREEDGWRLIAGPVDRLYRAADDPGEAHDLAGERPDVVADLKTKLLAEWERRKQVAFPPESREITASESEALQSLGYVAGGVRTDADEIERAFEEGEDPFTRTGLVDRINAGLALFRTGRLEESIVALREIVRDDPGNRFVLQQLGAALLEADRPAEARDALKAAAARWRNPDRVYLDLARAERALGNPAAEREALLEALSLYPASVIARIRLSRPYAEAGELEEAAALLREAVKIRPASVQAQLRLGQVCGMLGRVEEARRHLEKALELDGGGEASRYARLELEILDRSKR